MGRTSVVIVGAGPTGLTLACELARRDVPVRIVDRAPAFATGSRGKGLQPRSLEVLADLGVVDEVLTWGIPGIRFLHHRQGRPPEETLPRADLVARTDVPYPFGVIIPQWRTERILRDLLVGLGVSVEQDTEVVAFEQTDDGVAVTVRGPAGTTRIDADHLIGCDGGHSTVRKVLGLPFEGVTNESMAMLLGDVEVTGLPADHWHMWYADSGFVALCPFAGVSSWQFQAPLAPDPDGSRPEPSLETFRRIFADVADLPDVRLDNPTWLSTYRVNVRMVDRLRVGRVFLAGDAAHVHSPAGGLGMNTGIQDAYNLGWKLAAVHAGRADPALLDSYQDERLPIAAWTLGTSDERLRRMVGEFTTGGNGFGGAGGPDNRQLDLNYRWSALSRELLPRADDVLRAGDRAPDAPCRDGATGAPVRLHELFAGPHATLLGFGAGCRSSVHAVADAAPGGLPVRAHLVTGTDVTAPDAIVDETGAAARAYGVDGDALVLVRPDGYVGLIGGPADAPAVLGYLDHPAGRWLRSPA